ncbi:hypothetical protein GPJ56_007221 [Histomonas meleagridis]|nr:hypothetical protein GPJ56_007221 [Histomonas meleagridis]
MEIEAETQGRRPRRVAPRWQVENPGTVMTPSAWSPGGERGAWHPVRAANVRQVVQAGARITQAVEAGGWWSSGGGEVVWQVRLGGGGDPGA